MRDMIISYSTQRLQGDLLDAIVAQTVRQELQAQAEARRKAEAEHEALLAYQARRCNQLRADLIARNEAVLAPVIDRRWSPIDVAWGLWGLLILTAGAVKDAAADAGFLLLNAAAAGKAKAQSYRNAGKRKAARRKKYAARQREADKARRKVRDPEGGAL